MGFADPALVSGLVRGWHFGRYPATRSTTARERLAEVTPALLDALAKDSGDSAVLAFDRFLSRTPAGVQLFSLIGLERLAVVVAGRYSRRGATAGRHYHSPAACPWTRSSSRPSSASFRFEAPGGASAADHGSGDVL